MTFGGCLRIGVSVHKTLLESLVDFLLILLQFIVDPEFLFVDTSPLQKSQEGHDLGR